MTDPTYAITAGSADLLGAHPLGDGVSFAVFSAHAEKIEICLFSPDGAREIQRLTLPDRLGDIWHGFVPGLPEGALYGLRAHGPYEPQLGHRFNPAKLLIDPYARRLSGRVIPDDALLGYDSHTAQADMSIDHRDSARFMPKCVVTSDPPALPRGRRVARDRVVIYEAHPKGLTAAHPGVPEGLRGRFAGLASDAVIEHLLRLGITTLELLPVQAHADEPFLLRKGLTNYWGYNTLAFFAPETGYTAHGDPAEFRDMVTRLHEAGIEVVLDVVYNHTAEGNELGPTLSFRGLDNASYYRLSADNPRYYVNDTGTGNTVDCAHPMVMRMILDSLRYWVEQMGVDGFRFDLAPVLGREPSGFIRDGRFLSALRQDPVLANTRLIAEPWDVGPGGYQLGNFPPPFLEWNDRFRDGVRRFWRGEGNIADLAERVTGSAPTFDHHGRAPQATVNFVTAHDGFTLADVTAYEHKHNLPNHEGNRDGHNENYSDNLGHEGPTEDPAINAARARRRRNMLATLMLSQGTPMLLAGDEIANSQQGNNNAYCQDNPTGWIDWQAPDQALADFTAKLIALRHAHPVLHQRRFLHSLPIPEGGRDLVWHLPNGAEPSSTDWQRSDLRALALEIRMAANSPERVADPKDAAFIAINGGAGPVQMILPALPQGGWMRVLDSADPLAQDRAESGTSAEVAPESIAVFMPEEGRA
ncbi:MAG TPA: glycogen debranching protein GlgX [Paracoccus sp. (in: a-proteobacteria)]|uniref:glycogen debranching protein GlgX n=1 Tax=uncultured Paracoccus sp. TaxID=189685 RepID=UPI00262D6087|nr:glycogen debranching protein GlgX [uncultured Paracoccus sp.]HMQ40284.1 glycogen debranching protein GlgX [Paracoccus sp. (in: a-proteobacteria)]HMR35254.1 glycogen debranching protein GlgX [Paracoccus sp. (in: a-proteobacteria)]